MMAVIRSSSSPIDDLNVILLDLAKLALGRAFDVGVKQISESTIGVIVDYLSGNTSKLCVINAAKDVDNYYGDSSNDSSVLSVIASSAYAVVHNFYADYEGVAYSASELFGEHEVSSIIRRHMPLRKLLLTLSSKHP